MKILLFDVETTPNISYTWFGKYEVDVIEFVEEGYIMSFAYKWLGEKKVKAHSISNLSRRELVKELWELFNEADIIIAHNGNQFDIKWANRAFILHGFKPPSPYKQIDTLSIARTKFKFNSNKLNDLGKYLGLGSKIETGGFKLWKKCMAGDKRAFNEMIRYNKQDVVLLEKVYLKLRPYMHNHPLAVDVNQFACPVCGSRRVQKRGWMITAGGIYRKKRYQCQECGKWSASNKERIKDKENNLVCV